MLARNLKMSLRQQQKQKQTDVSCFNLVFEAIRRGVKAGYKFMKILLAATEAGWDVRRCMSQITTVCRQLIAPCLLNIL